VGSFPTEVGGFKPDFWKMKHWYKISPELFKKQPYYLTGCDN
jgi:hypothetical protein